MKNIVCILFIVFLSVVNVTFAVEQALIVSPSPVSVKWISKNSSDEITIHNGNGFRIMITINVDHAVHGAQATGVNQLGVNIKNCGDTKHIDAGSSAVCITRDSANPVRFSSDSQSHAVSGTYSINQK